MEETTLDLCAAAECVLFVSREPTSASRLAECLGLPVERIPSLIAELSARLTGHGLQVVSLAGGYSLATREEHADLVRSFLAPRPEELSRQALETLAVIAYRQPITRPQIEAVRGVNSAATVRALLDKGLVKTAGREKAPGRPFLFITSDQFLSLFGLASLGDLPALSEDAVAHLARSYAAGESEELPEEEAPFEFDA